MIRILIIAVLLTVVVGSLSSEAQDHETIEAFRQQVAFYEAVCR